MDENGKICSVISRPFHVKFKNNSNLNVDVIWIDYKGDETKYDTLKPGAYILVSTYLQHYWIFQEPISKRLLKACGLTIFSGDEYFKLHEVNKRPLFLHGYSHCINIYVENVKSLRDSCLDIIFEYVKSKDDIDSLEIPKILQTRLCERLLIYNAKKKYNIPLLCDKYNYRMAQKWFAKHEDKL